jgi:hypothetical protein
MDILIKSSRISSDKLARSFSYCRPPNLELLDIPLYQRDYDPTISNLWREQKQ